MLTLYLAFANMLRRMNLKRGFGNFPGEWGGEDL